MPESDLNDRWYPTPQLRWLTQSMDGKAELQQMWQHEETGHTTWRDIPTYLSDSGPDQNAE